MNLIRLEVLAVQTEAAVTVLRGGADVALWSNRIAAGGKGGRPKDPVDGGGLWTRALPPGSKEGIKTPPREE